MNKKALKAPSKILKSPYDYPSNSLTGSTNSLYQSEQERNPEQLALGDRVFVNGAKPGYIHYIGPTKFAPGDWAGIVLDEPQGKNDGSVEGVKYFNCDPNHGLFTKLAKLSRLPSNSSTPTPMRNTRDVTMSPASSVKSMSNATNRLKVGDRVNVNATNGVKNGILRYIGATEFASGEWAGIELDEPIGKNDGSVAGKRYFDCQPLFGLFAPVYKVSKSYARLSLNSPAHKANSGSCESLTSSISSASSATRSKIKLGVMSLNKRTRPPVPNLSSSNQALQEALKEKAQHIEQLLQERDIERAEVAKYAAQIEEYEHKMKQVYQETQQTREENNKHLSHFQQLLVSKDKEGSALMAQLEDDRRKIEDLQFQLEEESISKMELENFMKQKREEENEKGNLSNKTDVAALENEVFNKEELILQLEVSIEDQQKNIQLLSQTNSDLKNKLENEESVIQKYMQENADLMRKIEVTSSQFESEANRSNSIHQEYEQIHQNLSEMKNKNFNLEKALKEKMNKLVELEAQLQQKDKDSLLLQTNLNNIQKDFQELSSGKESNVQLSQRQIEEYKQNEASWRRKAEELELKNEKLQARSNSLEGDLNEVHKSMQTQEKELRETVSQANELVNNLQKECSQLKTQIGKLKDENKDFQKDHDLLIKEMEAKMKQDKESIKAEKDLVIKKSEEQFTNLKSTLAHYQNQFAAYKSEIQDKLGQSQKECFALSELRQQMDAQQQSLKHSNSQLEQALNATEKLQNTVNNLSKEKEEFRLEIVSLQNQLEAAQSRERELSNMCDNQKNLLRDHVNKVMELENEIIVFNKTSQGDKKHLESKVVEMQVALAQNKSPSLREDKMKEELDTLRHQVDFLNSLIVDMHRKNDLLKSQLELAAEKDASPQDHFNLNGVKPVVAPRLFCDICDRFDLHDTEDCPCQAGMEEDTSSHSNPLRPRALERPYCENCEIFDHWTHQCQENETF